MAHRKIIILGSTGSIGTQAIDVVGQAALPDGTPRFSVTALSAGGGNLELLAEQAVALRVLAVGISTHDGGALRSLIDSRAASAGLGGFAPEILTGPDASTAIAAWGAGTEDAADVVLNGITGSIGLAPTLAALGTTAILALANKESLIVGGALVKAAASPGQIVPVDSEHSALAQALRSGSAGEVDKLIVTASGGPFRGRTREELVDVTPEQALKHPTWDMGPMVTTNSATLVNKGLEVIEAHLLFDVPLDRIEAVVHPQSVIHSMVQFTDGSTIAQASPPDMRLPIALGLGWPERVPGAAVPCDWTKAATWTFEPLDNQAFPAVELAKEAARRGSTCPAVYNAANEEAVHAFHAGKIGFLDIVDTIAQVLSEHTPQSQLTLQSVLDAEVWARARANELLAAKA
ncbi:1-deoxy-D-xylulose-5-phosphate reductoisomerase [Arthrobacter stackebrandtii]|uniref:1-deoxy-D-xylulose 5-phosphate reductoisomerase n=1 Tax=Arthrobacter stackebrandtii TaxID=272161 RepID=A0ABS4YRA5_9MICC|nr:1-deoxy-D-xylulose-5-phosphate reductoisomerase [Arthrobacter stackebrandtii]MBP2411323.1 1-deoxy-D-xylulose-5-phosphate reductoisomerase [Arthrobacter stackebrandtii]PYH00150.1 1-deoxy-D-xylulose-5-phosphate reductoisomerase [Arthrobacter stackebrandtii]